MASDELEVQVRRPCPQCRGKGEYELGEGWKTSTGSETARCQSCQGTGDLEVRWIPLSILRDLLAG